MKNLPQRKQLRLKNYDYSQAGYYFVTICAQDKEPYLGHIRDGSMELNPCGQIVDQCISKIEEIHRGVRIDCKTIMPNHIHIIIYIVGVADPATRNITELSMQEKSKMLLPKIIQQFKTATINRIKQIGGLQGKQPFQWQRGYYEHVIRNEKAYQNMYEYIETNPLKWELDEYYSD